MSVYFLHIPRTSGIFVSHNVVPHLISSGVPHFVSNRTNIDIDTIKNSKYVSGHFARFPIEFMKNPIIYSIIRNPVERWISYFKYTTGLIRTKQEIEEKLDSWLYGDKAELNSNMQSKFITGTIDIDQFNKDIAINISRDLNHRILPVTNGWYLKDYSLNIDHIKNNIHDMNMYTLENHKKFRDDFNNELYKQFGFKTFKNVDKFNESFDIGLKLTNKQLSKIEELNSIDMEIYSYVQKIEKK